MLLVEFLAFSQMHLIMYALLEDSPHLFYCKAYILIKQLIYHNIYRVTGPYYRYCISMYFTNMSNLLQT
jgi:hypothetical protein